MFDPPSLAKARKRALQSLSHRRRWNGLGPRSIEDDIEDRFPIVHRHRIEELERSSGEIALDPNFFTTRASLGRFRGDLSPPSDPFSMGADFVGGDRQDPGQRFFGGIEIRGALE